MTLDTNVDRFASNVTMYTLNIYNNYIWYMIYDITSVKMMKSIAINIVVNLII